MLENKDVDKKELTKLKLFLISKYHIVKEGEHTMQRLHKTKKTSYFIQAILRIIKKVYQNECLKISKEYCINKDCLDFQFHESLKLQCFQQFLKISAGNYMLFNDIERLRTKVIDY